MAKTSSYDAVDEFVLDRWAQSRDLAKAFKQTSKKMRRRFRKVGAGIEKEFSSRGYSLVTDDRWAEFRAHKPEWCLADGKPAVCISVGGLLPEGFFLVQEASGYACVYLRDLGEESSADDNRRFAQSLYAQLGGKPADWADRTDDDNWTAPLYTSIPHTADLERVALARDSKLLEKLTLDNFERLFAFEGAVTKAIGPFFGK
jgi:hypothetical protein